MDGPLNPGSVKFENRSAQLVLVLFFSLILLIGVAMLATSETRAVGAVFAVLAAVLAIRAANTSLLEADSEGVSLRSFVRTTRYEYRQIRDVELAVGQPGVGPYERQSLVLVLVSGDRVRFTDLNASPKAERPTVVEQAIAHIRDAISVDPS